MRKIPNNQEWIKSGVCLLTFITLRVVHHLNLYFITRRRKRRREEEEEPQQDAETTPTKKDPFPQIPIFPNAHPIFGHLLTDLTCPYLHDMKTQSPQTLRKYSYRGMSSILYYANHPIILLFDPTAAMTMLQSHSYRTIPYLARKHLRAQSSPKNILLLNGKEWKLYRSAIHKAMTAVCLKDYQYSMVKCSLTMSKSLQAQITKNHQHKLHKIQKTMKSLMKMITLDIFFLVTMNIELKSCTSLQPSKIGQCFESSMDDFTRRTCLYPLRPWNFWYIFPSMENIRYYWRERYKRNIIGKYINERRMQRNLEKEGIMSSSLLLEGRKEEGVDGNSSSKKKKKKDLLTHYLDAQEKSEDTTKLVKMTNEDFLGLISTLLIAGFETTSSTLTYAFYLLSTRPDIEKYVLEEIHTVIGGKKEVLDDDDDGMDFDIEKLVLCKAIINETIRLYPVAYQTARSIPKGSTVQVNGVNIHGPAFVRIPIWAIQRDEENFPRPTEFSPERWVRLKSSSSSHYDNDDDDNNDAIWKKKEWVERFVDDECEEEKEWREKYNIPPAKRDAFFAFSAGARSCAGKKFAYQEAIIILAFLIRDLKFEAEEGYVCVPKRTGVTQSPEDGIPMYISIR